MFFIKTTSPIPPNDKKAFDILNGNLSDSILYFMVTEPNIKTILFKPEPPFDSFDSGILNFNVPPLTRICLYNTRLKVEKEIPFVLYMKMVSHYKKTQTIMNIGIPIHLYKTLQKFLNHLPDELEHPYFAILKCPATGRLFSCETSKYLTHKELQKPVLANEKMAGLGLFSTDKSFEENFSYDQLICFVGINKSIKQYSENVLYAPRLAWNKKKYPNTYDWSIESSKDQVNYIIPQLHVDFLRLLIKSDVEIAMDDETIIYPTLSEQETEELYNIGAVYNNLNTYNYRTPTDSISYLESLSDC